MKYTVMYSMFQETYLSRKLNNSMAQFVKLQVWKII
jgi:hypothetical protein